MDTPGDAINAVISVAFKAASKDLRSRFASKDWMVSEAAGRELADMAAAALSGFEITRKPMDVSVAGSARGEKKWG